MSDSIFSKDMFIINSRSLLMQFLDVSGFWPTVHLIPYWVIATAESKTGTFEEKQVKL